MPFSGKKRFLSCYNFNIKTINPMIFIGNRAFYKDFIKKYALFVKSFQVRHFLSAQGGVKQHHQRKAANIARAAPYSRCLRQQFIHRHKEHCTGRKG